MSISVQEKKREIVLSEIIKNFSGKTYSEMEVNEIILKYYDDFCTLRRWLVEDGFIEREREVYTVKRK